VNASPTASTPEPLRNAGNLPPKPAEVIVAEAFYRQRDEIEILRTALADARAERDEADAYIKSLWRNNQLPRPMPETLRDRLVHKR